MGTSYLVRKKTDRSVHSLIRVCDDGAVEYLANGKWLPEPNAFHVLMGEIGEEVSAVEARDIAQQFGGTIDLESKVTDEM